MSVDRHYALRISNTGENSGARQAAPDAKDAAMNEKTAGEDLNVFQTRDADLHGLLRDLNNAMPGADRLLYAAFDLKAPAETLSVFGKIREGVKSDASVASQGSQSNTITLEEPAAANERALAQPPENPSAAAHDSIDSSATIPQGPVMQSSESLVGAQTRIDLANQTREFQTAFQTQGPAMSQQDAIDLLSVIRQLGEAFFQQAQNSVTKQEFEREKIALRRLIESKGK